MKKGIYQVRSDNSSYVKFLELAAKGKAEQQGERYLPEGVVERVYQVGGRKNPAIRIGSGFFSNAVRDYSEWRVKWWRECIQNAVDAGARHVELNATTLSAGTVVVSCQDDGRGMTEDVLFNKFLVLGESGKEQREGMIGGFGKAKELLVLPWLAWRIRTGNLEVSGSGLDYEVRKMSPVSGTLLEASMPADQHTDEASALEYLQRSSIRGVRFKVNGKSFGDSMRRGTFIKDLSYGKLYRNKSKKYGAVYVRANGLYMFQASSFDSKYGTIIVELEGDTTKLLTANRDSFRSWRHDEEIRRFVNEIVTEGERALKAKSGLVTEVWEGSGRVSNDQGMTDVLDKLGAVPPIPEGKAVNVEGAAAKDLLAVLVELAPMMSGAQDPIGLGPATGDVAKQIIHEPVIGATNAEAFARQLVWTPDFMVRNEIEGFHVPVKFRPEKMSAALSALAKVWAEACRWVFIQLGRHGEYGVGFVFAEDVLAMYRLEGGRHWLLLNPVAAAGRPGRLLSKTAPKDLKSIYASAVHEVTHMAYGYAAHDSAFAAALTNVMAETVDGWPVMKRIAKAVKQRKQPGAAKKPAAKMSKKTPVSLWLDSSEQIHMHIEDSAIRDQYYTTTIKTEYSDGIKKWIEQSLPSSELRMFEDSEEVLAMLNREIMVQLIGLANFQYLGNLDVTVEFASPNDLNGAPLDMYVEPRPGPVFELLKRTITLFTVVDITSSNGDKVLKAMGKSRAFVDEFGEELLGRRFDATLPVLFLSNIS